MQVTAEWSNFPSMRAPSDPETFEASALDDERAHVVASTYARKMLQKISWSLGQTRTIRVSSGEQSYFFRWSVALQSSVDRASPAISPRG